MKVGSFNYVHFVRLHFRGGVYVMLYVMLCFSIDWYDVYKNPNDRSRSKACGIAGLHDPCIIIIYELSWNEDRTPPINTFIRFLITILFLLLIKTVGIWKPRRLLSVECTRHVDIDLERRTFSFTFLIETAKQTFHIKCEQTFHIKCELSRVRLSQCWMRLSHAADRSYTVDFNNTFQIDLGLKTQSF